MKNPTLDGWPGRPQEEATFELALNYVERRQPGQDLGGRELWQREPHMQSPVLPGNGEGSEAGTVVEGTRKEMGQRSRLRPDYLGPLLAARAAWLEEWSLMVGRHNTFRKTVVCSNLKSIPNIH